MALTDLWIHEAAMEGRELEALVCSQCPRLKNLSLLVTLVVQSDVSIRSDSLKTLYFCIDNTRRVEIIAPRTKLLSVTDSDASVSEAHISAPKLAELVCDGHAFDSRLQFADTSRHLRALEGIMAYERFVNDTNNLPNCGTLSVSLYRNYHGFAPTMLRLLRKCNSIKNFTLYSSYIESSLKSPCCPLSCPCRLPESCKADNITLDSLKEVEIDLDKGSHEEAVEFVKQLSQCKVAHS